MQTTKNQSTKKRCRMNQGLERTMHATLQQGKFSTWLGLWKTHKKKLKVQGGKKV